MLQFTTYLILFCYPAYINTRSLVLQAHKLQNLYYTDEKWFTNSCARLWIFRVMISLEYVPFTLNLHNKLSSLAYKWRFIRDEEELRTGRTMPFTHVCLLISSWNETITHTYIHLLKELTRSLKQTINRVIINVGGTAKQWNKHIYFSILLTHKQPNPKSTVTNFSHWWIG